MPITEVTQETTPKSSMTSDLDKNLPAGVSPVSIGPKVANPATSSQSEPKRESRGFAQKGAKEVKGQQTPVNPIVSQKGERKIEQEKETRPATASI